MSRFAQLSLKESGVNGACSGTVRSVGTASGSGECVIALGSADGKGAVDGVGIMRIRDDFWSGNLGALNWMGSEIGKCHQVHFVILRPSPSVKDPQTIMIKSTSAQMTVITRP